MAVVGHWLLAVNVSNGVRSVGPCQWTLVTQTQPEPTDVAGLPGIPPPSPTVTLVGGPDGADLHRADTARPGAEFHATFFDAKGQELRMATFAAMGLPAIPGGLGRPAAVPPASARATS